jgi:hypothetical protein
VVEDDQDHVFSDAFENGDMARLHKLWWERGERIKAAEKRDRKRQGRWVIYAAYGSVLTALITAITWLSKWMTSPFPKGPQ